MEIEKFLRTKEAAQYLGLAPQTLCRWRVQGLEGRRIPFFRIGRAVVYDVADLDAFVKARRFQSTSEADLRGSSNA
jgi:excisionase family DNA binding protein